MPNISIVYTSVFVHQYSLTLLRVSCTLMPPVPHKHADLPLQGRPRWNTAALDRSRNYDSLHSLIKRVEMQYGCTGHQIQRSERAPPPLHHQPSISSNTRRTPSPPPTLPSRPLKKKSQAITTGPTTCNNAFYLLYRRVV